MPNGCILFILYANFLEKYQKCINVLLKMLFHFCLFCSCLINTALLPFLKLDPIFGIFGLLDLSDIIAAQISFLHVQPLPLQSQRSKYHALVIISDVHCLYIYPCILYWCTLLLYYIIFIIFCTNIIFIILWFYNFLFTSIYCCLLYHLISMQIYTLVTNLALKCRNGT